MVGSVNHQYCLFFYQLLYSTPLIRAFITVFTHFIEAFMQVLSSMLTSMLSLILTPRLSSMCCAFCRLGQGVLISTLIMLTTTASAQEPVIGQQNLVISHFAQGELTGWQEKTFKGNTSYQLIKDERGKTVLEASSEGSASGLFKEQRIDLQKTPYLNWSWKTNHLYQGLNEKAQSGDDFVARIYIVIDGGFFVWKTKALNYVWSSTYAVDSFWPNPYIDNATMFAVETGEANVGKWQTYKRNVRNDLQRVLGKTVRYIDAIAVMTDSDSAGQQALTYYGDIYFSPK